MGYPRLNDRFFTEKRPTREFFARLKDAAAWGPHLVPLYEWQGLLFVGISSTENVSVQANWCVVAANPELLSELWWELNAPAEEASAAPVLATIVPPPPSAEESIDLLQDVPETSDADKTVVAEELELVPDADKLQSPTKTISLDSLTRSGSAPSASMPQPPPPPTSIEMATEPVVAAAEPPPPPTPEFEEEIVTPVPPPRIAVAAAPKAPPSGKPASPMTGSNDDWQALWSALSGFEHSMVLLFQAGQCVPWKWDPSLKNSSNASLGIQKPSPFRIVARTQKPFHGQAVPNEVSDQFFQAWAQGHYPEHITMSPILNGENLVGMLMAWGSKACDTKECLQTVENSAEQLSRLFKKRPDLVAA